MSSTKALLAFCTEQPWWLFVEPLFAQDVVVDVHVAEIPEAAMRPDWPTRGEFGILVPKGKPGVVIVRICADCRLGEPWHVRLAPRAGVPLEQIVQQTIAQSQRRAQSFELRAAADSTTQKDWH